MWAWVCFSWSLMDPETLLQSLISGAENLTHCKYSRPNSIFGWTWCLNPIGKKSINSCTQKTRSKARVGWAGVKERKGTLKIGYSDFSTAGRLKQLDFFLVGLSLCSRKAGTAWRLCIATRSLEQWLQSRGKLLQVVHIRLHNVCCWLIESPLMATPEVFPSFTGAGCFPFTFRASLITGRFSGSWRKDLLEAQNWHKASLNGKLCWTEGLNS